MTIRAGNRVHKPSLGFPHIEGRVEIVQLERADSMPKGLGDLFGQHRQYI